MDWTAVVGAVADVKMDKEVPLPPKVSFLSPQLFPLNINLDIFNFNSGKWTLLKLGLFFFQVPDDFETNTEFLRSAHRALLEIEVINGKLVCPESQRVFQITDGIPNMLLNEDEV